MTAELEATVRRLTLELEKSRHSRDNLAGQVKAKRQALRKCEAELKRVRAELEDLRKAIG
jgi:chromosome segregation ATPase